MNPFKRIKTAFISGISFPREIHAFEEKAPKTPPKEPNPPKPPQSPGGILRVSKPGNDQVDRLIHGDHVYVTVGSFVKSPRKKDPPPPPPEPPGGILRVSKRDLSRQPLIVVEEYVGGPFRSIMEPTVEAPKRKQKLPPPEPPGGIQRVSKRGLGFSKGINIVVAEVNWPKADFSTGMVAAVERLKLGRRAPTPPGLIGRGLIRYLR